MPYDASHKEENRNDFYTKCNESMWNNFRIYKNLAIISLSNTIFNTAFNGISILQSTINRERGTGVASLAILYGVAFFTTILLPKVVIRRLGCKTTFAVSILVYGPYIAYNFYPHWGTLVPASIAAGIGSTLLWPSITTYVNRLSGAYQKRNGGTHISTNAFFFGIFGSIYATTGIWGNLISFYVLKTPEENMIPASNTSSVCGINYCEVQSNGNVSENLAGPDVNQRYMLTGIYLGLALSSVILVVSFMDSLEPDDRPRTSVLKDLKATFRVMIRTDQLLLIPLVIYTGLSYGFYGADVTKAYIACSWGIYRVGIVSLCSSACGVVSVMLCGWLVKYTIQPAAFFITGVINVAVFVIWFTWTPHEDTYYMLFLMSGLYGSYTSVMWTQLKSFYGVLFKEEEEAGYANDCLWNDVGLVAAFAFSNYFCVATKLYFLIVVFFIGYIGYGIVEYRQRLKNIKL